MPKYKDSNNKIYALDDATFEHLLPLACVEITEEEFQVIAEQIRLSNVPDPRSIMECSAWQFRRALNQLGLRAAVETAVAAADQDTKDMWEFATTYKRLHPLIISFGVALGQSEQDLDDLFALANSIEL